MRIKKPTQILRNWIEAFDERQWMEKKLQTPNLRLFQVIALQLQHVGCLERL